MGPPGMRDESFGPVVGVMPVASDSEAVALMNDSDFGLTASLWTADVEAAADIGRQIETGTIYMNRCDYLRRQVAGTAILEASRLVHHASAKNLPSADHGGRKKTRREASPARTPNDKPAGGAAYCDVSLLLP